MKKNLLRKCLITLGLLLFFTLLLPFTSYNVTTVKAADFEKEKVEYRLNVKTLTLIKGSTFTLKAYKIGENAKASFKSDNQEIASVNDEGTITANKVGVAVITATMKDGTTLTCVVTVGPPAFSVKVSRSRIILGKGSSDILKVILKPSNTAEGASFSSHDELIATISSSGGRITAVEYGLTYVFALIDAQNLDGTRKYSTSTVIVVKKDDVALLETYFNERPELNAIPEDELNAALGEYFNNKYDKNATTTLLAASLDRYLNDKFETIIKAAKEALAKLAASQSEVSSNSITK